MSTLEFILTRENGATRHIFQNSTLKLEILRGPNGINNVCIYDGTSENVFVFYHQNNGWRNKNSTYQEDFLKLSASEAEHHEMVIVGKILDVRISIINSLGIQSILIVDNEILIATAFFRKTGKWKCVHGPIKDSLDKEEGKS